MDKQIVKLNVGGKSFMTYLGTLRKENTSELSKMIVEPYQNEFFIDYDGDVFEHVLNYLRNGSIPKVDRVLEVYECAEYFGIKSLANDLKFFQPVVYNNMLSEMKQKMNISWYENVKQHAVEELSKYYLPKESIKYFGIIASRPVCPSYFQENGNMYVHAAEYSLPKPLKNNQRFMMVDCSLSTSNVFSNIMQCLGHELCKLGFGDFTSYAFNKEQFECSHNIKTTIIVIQLQL